MCAVFLLNFNPQNRWIKKHQLGTCATSYCLKDCFVALDSLRQLIATCLSVAPTTGKLWGEFSLVRAEDMFTQMNASFMY